VTTNEHDDHMDDVDANSSAEEFAAAFVHHLGRTPVRDLVIQAMATLADAAGIRMGLGPEGAEVADLAQARTAVEILRVLVAVTDQELGQAVARPFREPLAQLQLAYAKIAEANAGPAAVAETPPTQPDPASRLWVPPGGRPE
jgi:Domain of unknown function (DUF1844)